MTLIRESLISMETAKSVKSYLLFTEIWQRNNLEHRERRIEKARILWYLDCILIVWIFTRHNPDGNIFQLLFCTFLYNFSTDFSDVNPTIGTTLRRNCKEINRKISLQFLGKFDWNNICRQIAEKFNTIFRLLILFFCLQFL